MNSNQNNLNQVLGPKAQVKPKLENYTIRHRGGRSQYEPKHLFGEDRNDFNNSLCNFLSLHIRVGISGERRTCYQQREKLAQKWTGVWTVYRLVSRVRRGRTIIFEVFFPNISTEGTLI